MLRLATLDDVPELHALIDHSVRVLQAGDYSLEQIDAALGTVLGLDQQLIRDGTYFVTESDGRITGCGGWSKRKTLFGSDHVAGKNDALLDPASDAAKIRAFFIHPDYARQRLGTQILAACEKAATEAGFSDLELGATLTGERLFRRHGFNPIRRLEVPLKNGLSLPVIHMEKRILNPG
jgi:N-acetylglutamate synthase-like GNAT family acetyltransferase